MEKRQTTDKSMISSKIVCDSINWLGNRLTTMVLTYPRFIHADFMTHRVFSRNAESSRAMPASKLITKVTENPVLPMWTYNKPGQAGDQITDEDLIDKLNTDWLFARDFIINEVGALTEAGVHKQHTNRLLEPFQYYKVLVTATDWDNFFLLRDHEQAQPEIQVLAREMRKALAESTPEHLEMGQWHLPFGADLEDIKITENILLGKVVYDDGFVFNPNDAEENFRKIITARCARISYNTFEGTRDPRKDLDLYNKLVTSDPQHLSPTEHLARVPYDTELDQFMSGYLYQGVGTYKYHHGKYMSNLKGWIQYRKLIEDGSN